MPAPPAAPDIRQARRAAGFGRGAAVLGAATVTACGVRVRPAAEIDPLQAQLDLAAADCRHGPRRGRRRRRPLVPALTQIASERAEHAQALADEIARAAGTTSRRRDRARARPRQHHHASAPPPHHRPSTTSSRALRSSADSAAQLAPTLSGYRAGLLGSIAASCTASLHGRPDAPKPAS